MRQMLLSCVALVLAAAGYAAENGFDDRHKPYRLQPMDIVEVHYRYTPEFNETLEVGPDGMVGSQVAGEVRAEGMTLEGLRAALTERSRSRLRDPELQILLKKFVEPHYVVAGEVNQPGRFVMRGAMTALEAIAVAGGFNPNAKHSQVLLVRRVDGDSARVVELNMKRMMKNPASAEDPVIRRDDLLIVPRSRLSSVERFVKWSNVGIFWNPSL